MWYENRSRGGNNSSELSWKIPHDCEMHCNIYETTIWMFSSLSNSWLISVNSMMCQYGMSESRSATFPIEKARHLLDDSFLESQSPVRNDPHSTSVSNGLSLGMYTLYDTVNFMFRTCHELALGQRQIWETQHCNSLAKVIYFSKQMNKMLNWTWTIRGVWVSVESPA